MAWLLNLFASDGTERIKQHSDPLVALVIEVVFIETVDTLYQEFVYPLYWVSCLSGLKLLKLCS